MNETSLYPYTLREAWDRNELRQFNDSLFQNAQCARDIERSIHGHFAGGVLRAGCAEAVLEQYGFKRVNFVLANSVKEMERPEQISEEARNWCGRIHVPPNEMYNRYFAVSCDVPLLESFIGQTRQAYQALGLFGPEHCDGDRHEQDYTGKVLVLSPDTLRESCWTPENQLWYAHDGFGCSPHAIGRSIRCTCLGDGEMTRWNRSDFIGALDEQYLPDWAKERLEELCGLRQEQDAAPTMGGMTMN